MGRPACGAGRAIPGAPAPSGLPCDARATGPSQNSLRCAALHCAQTDASPDPRKASLLGSLNALEFEIKSGQYISRVAVQQASATAMAAAAQTCRSMPDSMERQGLGAKWCAIVEQVDDDTLNSLADQYAAMTAPPEGVEG